MSAKVDEAARDLIEQLHALSAQSVGAVLGCTLLGLLAVHAGTLWAGTLRRLYLGREERALNRERLQLAIRAAKLQWQEADQMKLLWNGYRKFRVVKKIAECGGVDGFKASDVISVGMGTRVMEGR